MENQKGVLCMLGDCGEGLRGEQIGERKRVQT